MATDWQLCVQQFHEKFSVPVGQTPHIDSNRVGLRASLIMEEALETVHAMQGGDLAETADGLCDLIYVALGAAVEFGIDLEPLFEAVHISNLKKENGPIRGDGKLLKPPGWTKPPIAQLLLLQVARTENARR